MLLDNIWIINLKRSKERLDHMTHYMNKYNLQFNIFDAIDGKLLSEKEIQENSSWACRTFLCNKSIIGCAMSHMGIWKQLLNDISTDYYLIFEDDAVFDESFINLFPEVEKKINEYDIDFLSFYCSGFFGCNIKPEFEINGIKFGKPSFPLSLPSYVISKKCAKKLLDNLEKSIQTAIDFEISQFALSGDINIYLSEKNIVTRNDDFQSTIKSTKNEMKPITYNIIKYLNISTLAWDLSYPVIHIGMKYEINWFMICLFILIVLNYFVLKNDILGLFLFLELLLTLS